MASFVGSILGMIKLQQNTRRVQEMREKNNFLLKKILKLQKQNVRWFIILERNKIASRKT